MFSELQFLRPQINLFVFPSLLLILFNITWHQKWDLKWLISASNASKAPTEVLCTLFACSSVLDSKVSAHGSEPPILVEVPSLYLDIPISGFFWEKNPSPWWRLSYAMSIFQGSATGQLLSSSPAHFVSNIHTFLLNVCCIVLKPPMMIQNCWPTQGTFEIPMSINTPAYRGGYG